MRMAGSAARLEKPAREDSARADDAEPARSDAPPTQRVRQPANPLDRIIGYKLRRAQLVTFQEFIEFFSSVKLRPAEFALIMVLQDQPGLSQTDAAKMLGIKRANFVALLDALEQRDLAERRAVHGDRRARALHLTDKGKRLAAKAARMSASYEERLVSRLGGPEERDRFLAMLDRLMERG